MAFDLASILATAKVIVWAIVILGSASLIIWWALVFRKYNRIVEIHDLTGQSSMIRTVKAREKMDDKNVLCWYLRKEKIMVPCPPKEAISIKGGKKYATLVRVRGDQYHWVDITAFTSDIDGQMGSVGKFFVIAEDAKRQLADQIKKAEQEKNTKLNDLINKVMPIMAIAILLIGAYFIYDVIATKNVEATEILAGAVSQMAKITENQNKLMDRQLDILNYRNNTVMIGQNINVPRPVPN